MADLARIKRNVAKMASMNAPEADIDGYIASEGVSIDDVRNFKPQEKDYTLGRLGTIDRGVTFGLGRKLGGIVNAIGSYPVDRVAEALGVQNTPSFMDRYHEIVDPTMEAINQYHEDKPAEAFALELGAGFANPANKLGVNFIKNGTGLANTALRSSAVGGGIGTVAGALNAEKTEDVLPYGFGGGVGGAVIGGALPLAANRAGAVYNAGKRIFMPEASVAGKATGLGNVIKDNDSVRALTRGIMASDDVAEQVLREAPSEMGRLNEELSDILNKTTGRKLNIKKAKANADEAYKSYVAANADYPVFTTEEVNNIPMQAQQIPTQSVTQTTTSTFDNPVNYTLEEWLAQPRKINQGYKNISLDDYRVRNGYPIPGDDIIDKMRMPHGMSDNDKRLLAQQYEKNKALYDKSAQEYKELLDSGKLPTYEDILEYNGAKETSEKKIAAARMAWKKAQKQAENNQNLINQLNTGQYADIPFGALPENVKQNVPNIKQIISTLNDYKAGKMQEALAKGAAMSDYPMGSLDATHKAQGVLNDMIEASYDTSVLGVKKPTTETSQLMDLKQVFNNMLEPSGVKPLDARIAKAKSLEYFRDMGYKFKPSETKFEDLGIKTLRDKRAFLQGRLQNILDNVKDDKNLAKAIRADENTLKKLMPAKKFNELINKTSEIDREYTRLNKFARLAAKELDKPLAADRPMSERSETIMSYLGSLYDKTNAAMWQNANRRRAQALLNGGAVNPEWAQRLEGYGRQYSPQYLAPYIAQLAAQNQ